MPAPAAGAVVALVALAVLAGVADPNNPPEAAGCELAGVLLLVSGCNKRTNSKKKKKWDEAIRDTRKKQAKAYREFAAPVLMERPPAGPLAERARDMTPASRYL
jgi:negative regulator of sigma E activity